MYGITDLSHVPGVLRGGEGGIETIHFNGFNGDLIRSPEKSPAEGSDWS